MRHFPLFADLRDKPVLVVGAGPIADRKVALLVSSGARVTVGARAACERIRARADSGEITLIQGEFDPAWLASAWLVVAATNDTALNRTVADAASAQRLFCNVVDDPALSSAQVPAIVDRDPVTIAISSGGSAPMIARRLRARIEAMVDPAIGALAALARTHRPAIRQTLPDLSARRRFYDWLMDGPVLSALRRHRGDEADARLCEALTQGQSASEGRVLLVGAGPGDPGLLTLRGLRALNEADVILYDRLVSEEVLSLARRDAERIDVGKVPGGPHEATQDRIHALMVSHARKGRCVVRLKGGDPMVFGRGGEELQYLRRHRVTYEVVPGITAALACGAYAGIPLTHRDHAQSLTLATAHRRGPDAATESDTSGQAPGRTRVYYMGVGRLAALCARLKADGEAGEMPCALVENGSRAGQRALYATLDTLEAAASAHAIASPALLIVGEVAALGPALSWFGECLPAGPLSGKADTPAALTLAA